MAAALTAPATGTLLARLSLFLLLQDCMKYWVQASTPATARCSPQPSLPLPSNNPQPSLNPPILQQHHVGPPSTPSLAQSISAPRPHHNFCRNSWRASSSETASNTLRLGRAEWHSVLSQGCSLTRPCRAAADPWKSGSVIRYSRTKSTDKKWPGLWRAVDNNYGK